MKKSIFNSCSRNKAVGDRRFHNFIVKNYETETETEIETEDGVYSPIKRLQKPKIMNKKMGRNSAWKKINKN